MFKYLILLAVIYGIYRFSQMQKALDTKRMNQLDQEEDDPGFSDYEEVE